MNYIDDVTIVGGGTAGLMAALITQKVYPNKKITIIESSKLGILGAGEGTTPNFIHFLNDVNISFYDFVKNTSASIKSAINFKGWGQSIDGEYLHDFVDNNDDIDNYVINDSLCVDDVCLARYLNDENLTPFIKTNGIQHKPIFNFALHFDANKTAQYLKRIAQNRNINIIDAIVTGINTDTNGFVTSLDLDNQMRVHTKFVFDSTGFKRLIIGNFYKVEWEDYSNYLPLNTAMPFFINHNNNVSPQTDAITLKNGWMWKIPVKDRYGCGYVYDSRHCSEEDAIREIRDYFNDQTITYPKTFKFNPGTFKKTLYKNVMAVGLSQSFFEPLEATSIWISHKNINSFVNGDGLNNFNNEDFIKEFNDLCFERNQQTMRFINFHYYLCKRNDSDFWKSFRALYKEPKVIEIIADLKNKMNTSEFKEKYKFNDTFSPISWLKVYHGTQNDNRNVSHKISQFLRNDFFDKKNLFISHKDFMTSEKYLP